jgi:hypothetical protein
MRTRCTKLNEIFKGKSLNELGCLPVKDHVPSYAKKWIKQHDLGTALLVPKRQNCMTASGKSKKCHWNVSALTQMYGGFKLRGLSLTVADNFCFFTCHSVWITPEYRIVDVTLDNNDGAYTRFIPFGIYNQHLLSSVVLYTDYARRGLLINFSCNDVNAKLRDALNYPIKKVGCNDYIVVPANKFKKGLFQTYQSDESALDNDAFSVADFTLPSKFTGKYWSQIVQERLSLQTQSH